VTALCSALSIAEAVRDPSETAELPGLGDKIPELRDQPPIGHELMFHDLLVEVVADIAPMDFVVTPGDVDLARGNRWCRRFTKRTSVQYLGVS
jgi:hypothetical protein